MPSTAARPPACSLRAAANISARRDFPDAGAPTIAMSDRRPTGSCVKPRDQRLDREARRLFFRSVRHAKIKGIVDRVRQTSINRGNVFRARGPTLTSGKVETTMTGSFVPTAPLEPFPHNPVHSLRRRRSRRSLLA